MNMITEDYVSFEIAKLLKEKGFEGRMHTFYTEEGTEMESAYVVPSNFFPIYRPTLQMAMKWLMNKHDVVCSVGLFTNLPETPPYWSFNILNQSTANVMYEAFDIKCESYEQAAESAIKYCLENLI